MASIIDWALSHSADFLDLEQHGAKLVADWPPTHGHGEIIRFVIADANEISALVADVKKVAADFPGFTLTAIPNTETLGDELAKALEAKHAGDPHALAAIDIGGIVAAFEKWLPLLIEIWNQFRPKA